MSESVRVLLADDEESIRMLVRMALKGAPEVSIVGEANTGVEAVRLAAGVEAGCSIAGPEYA